MKTIILFLISLSAYGSVVRDSAPKHNWLKLGYEVAYTHAPDIEIAKQIIGETCEEAKEWAPNYNMGESYQFAPSTYDVVYYYEGHGLIPLYYKCTKPIKEG